MSHPSKIAKRINREPPYTIFVKQIRAGRIGLIVEGDSWVSNPTHEDIYDWINKTGDYTTVPYYGVPGKLLEVMDKDGYYASYLHDDFAKDKIKCMVLSGGGNDFLMEKRLKRIIKKNASGAAAVDFINRPTFKGVLDRMQKHLENIIKTVARAPTKKVVPIVIHTYAYPVPGDRKADFHPKIPFGLGLGPWLYRVFKPGANNVPEAMWDPVTFYLVDAYFERLKRLEKKYQHFHVVDLRTFFGTGKQRIKAWADEIHLNDPSYKKVTKAILTRVEKVRLK